MEHKIAFVVEHDFELQHFGVRNFFTTIKRVLESEGYVADYLEYRPTHRDILWYKINFEETNSSSESLAEDFLEYHSTSFDAKITFRSYEVFAEKHAKSTCPVRKYERCIGSNLVLENYDIAFITNPWLVDKNLHIEAKKTVGIVYDFHANYYILSRDTPMEWLFNWAHRHENGYQYYNKICDFIVCDSSEVAMEYAMFNNEIDSGRIGYFKPFITYDLGKEAYKETERKNAIVLAAPFDLRKGLKSMPELLNSLGNRLETLYVFGLPRCSPEDFNNFFKELRVQHIIYYPHISFQGLAEIYRKCRFLLFPSKEEGLGLPIMEAQWFGCRPIVLDRAPMNKLGLHGTVLLGDDMNRNIQSIKEAFADYKFSHKALSKKAREKFSYKELVSFVDHLLGEKQ